MKIALIAMSGIRVCDQELLKLGLTLPGFVERSKTIASLPSLGLLTLAGMTDSRHQVDYIEVPDLGSWDSLPKDYDLVGISTYSAQVSEAYDLASRFRALKVPVVMGGPHVTALPEEALQYCDSVVIGEGEAVWNQVLEDKEAGKLQPQYGKINGGFDLSQAPMPDFSKLDISKYNRLTVQTSRGCPHHCEFCASSVIISHHYHQKPVEKVLAEIDEIKKIWEHPFLEFADDNAMVNKAYWKELLVELKKRNIRWFAETDLSISEDEDLLGLMREAGCAQILIGLESPEKSALQGVELQNNWKYKHYEEYRESIRKIQSHGITVNGCFVLGLDGHTPDIFDKVYDFVKETNLYEVQITLMTAFPGTPLYERLLRENRILEPGNWNKCTLFDVNYQPAKMSKGELEAGFKKLAVSLYEAEFTKWRRDRFKERLRESYHFKGN
jgi:radical SAM superfamily enzyme YgiQ (UPF0313 family)